MASKFKRQILRPYYLMQEVSALLGEVRAHLVEVKSELALAMESRQQQSKDVAALLVEFRAQLETDNGKKYYNALRGVGILNYQNDDVSGERRFLSRFVATNPTAVVFDVGANTGQYSRLVREIGPRTVVHSFEPHPAAFEKLAEAAAIDGFAAHGFALGDNSGEIEFFDYADEEGSQHASIYREVIEGLHGRPAASQKVRCETLDTVIAGMAIPSINLLKIDTEGHELAVLKGARQALASGTIDVIQFEFNEMNVISRVFMKDFFDILPNYRFFRLLGQGVIEFTTYEPNFVEVFAFQNIVCIRNDIDHNWVY